MMKFGQWGDKHAKEDGSFSFGPVNVVNSTAHTAPSALIKEEGRSCGGAGACGVAEGELYRAGWRVTRKGGRGRPKEG